MPVSKSAWPTMNMATQRMTLLLTKPAKAVLASRTPVMVRPIQTIIAVSARGIFSQTNITTAKARNKRVIVLGLIRFSSQFNIVCRAKHRSFRSAIWFLPYSPFCALSESTAVYCAKRTEERGKTIRFRSCCITMHEKIPAPSGRFSPVEREIAAAPANGYAGGCLNIFHGGNVQKGRMEEKTIVTAPTGSSPDRRRSAEDPASAL